MRTHWSRDQPNKTPVLTAFLAKERPLKWCRRHAYDVFLNMLRVTAQTRSINIKNTMANVSQMVPGHTNTGRSPMPFARPGAAKAIHTKESQQGKLRDKPNLVTLRPGQNEDTLRQHCWRDHVSQMVTRFATRATFVSDTNLVSWTHKMFLKIFRNICCVRRAPRNNVAHFTTGGHHRRTQCCRHNVSSFCQGFRGSTYIILADGRDVFILRSILWQIKYFFFEILNQKL